MAGLYELEAAAAGRRAQEVNHRLLVAHLLEEFPDGWALSTSQRSLRDVLALVPADVDVRIGAWTKPAPPHRTRWPRSAWEPVIVAGGRPWAHGGALDWTHAGQLRTYPGQIVGTKPPAFCAWLFAMLGALPGDELLDLFPGSGAVGHAWRVYASPDVAGDTSDVDGADASAVVASDASHLQPVDASNVDRRDSPKTAPQERRQRPIASAHG